MYFNFAGPAGRETLKIPEEIAGEMPANLTSDEREAYISDLIHSDTYYRKIIPQAIAEFLRYFYINSCTPGGYMFMMKWK